MIDKQQKTITGKAAYKQGKWAETIARLYLTCKGYKCLGRRIRTPLGEVDLLCAKAKQLVVIEVKSAANIHHAIDSPIRYKQQQNLIKAGNYLYGKYRRDFTEGVRIDAVFIDPKSFAIKHHRNITQ